MPRPQLSPKVPYCRFLLQSSAGRDCKMAILCYLNLMKIYYLKIVPDRQGSFSYGGGRPCEVGKPSLWYRFTSTSRHPSMLIVFAEVTRVNLHFGWLRLLFQKVLSLCACFLLRSLEVHWVYLSFYFLLFLLRLFSTETGICLISTYSWFRKPKRRLLQRNRRPSQKS